MQQRAVLNRLAPCLAFAGVLVIIACGDEGEPSPHFYEVRASHIHFAGVFMTKAVITAEATDGQRQRKEESWIEAESLAKLLADAAPSTATPAEVLTARLIIQPSGELSWDYVGAQPHEIAMRGYRRHRGERFRLWAVAGEQEKPYGLMENGLPPPQSGSLVCTLADFSDESEVYAGALTLEIADHRNVFLIEVDQSGTVTIMPGEPMAGAEPGEG